MDTTISLSRLWKVFKETWWKILIVTLVAVLLVGAVTVLLIPKKYSSSAEFYIVNVDHNIDYANSSTLAANEYLAENYIAIIQGDEMMLHLSEVLKEEEGLDLRPGKIRSMISTARSDTLAIFTVTVTDTDPTTAYQVARYLTKEAPAVVTRIARPSKEGTDGAMIPTKVPVTYTINELADALITIDEEAYGDVAEQMMEVYYSGDERLLDYDATVVGYYNANILDCITPLRMPVESDTAVSPNPIRNCLLGGVIAAVVMYVIFFLLDMFNTTIYTEEDIKAITDLPILGTVPSWDHASGQYYSHYDNAYGGKE